VVTRKHRRFVLEYLKDLNATNAAKRAGYSQKTAYSQGQRLLKHVEVKRILEELSQKFEDESILSAKQTLQELSKLARYNMADFIRVGPDGEPSSIDVSQLTRDQAAAIQEITVDTTGGTGDGERRQVLRTKFKLADKGMNLERLGRYHKLFTDKVEMSGEVSLAESIAKGRKALMEAENDDK
jgi:phage terminase small subunit